MLEEMDRQPPPLQAALAPLRQEYQGEIDKLTAQRVQLLGETVRFWGGKTAPGGEVPCRVSLRLRAPRRIDFVQLEVEFAGDRLEFVGTDPPDGAAAPVPLAHVAGGRLHLAVIPPVGDGPWSADEHQLGVVRFRARPGAAGVIDLRVKSLEVREEGEAVPGIQALDGLVFIERPLEAVAAAPASGIPSG
jgi:hypothetical protein